MWVRRPGCVWVGEDNVCGESVICVGEERECVVRNVGVE